MQNLLGPFGDEAVAAFITAFVSAIVAYWLHRRSRERPTIIECREVGRLNLIPVGVAEVFPFSYGNVILQRPWLIRMELVNKGTTAIKMPSITFEVSESVKMLQPRLQVEPERRMESVHVSRDRPNSITITLDYLNPVQAHREKLTVDLICDGDAETVKVLGGGEGWSVLLRTSEELLRTAYAFLLPSLMIVVVAIIASIAILIRNISADPSVSQALISLWDGSIRTAVLLFLAGTAFAAFLVRWGELKTGVSFFYGFLFRTFKIIVRNTVNFLSRRKMRWL